MEIEEVIKLNKITKNSSMMITKKNSSRYIYDVSVYLIIKDTPKYLFSFYYNYDDVDNVCFDGVADKLKKIANRNFNNVHEI